MSLGRFCGRFPKAQTAVQELCEPATHKVHKQADLFSLLLLTADPSVIAQLFSNYVRSTGFIILSAGGKHLGSHLLTQNCLYSRKVSPWTHFSNMKESLPSWTYFSCLFPNCCSVYLSFPLYHFPNVLFVFNWWCQPSHLESETGGTVYRGTNFGCFFPCSSHCSTQTADGHLRHRGGQHRPK